MKVKKFLSKYEMYESGVVVILDEGERRIYSVYDAIIQAFGERKVSRFWISSVITKDVSAVELVIALKPEKREGKEW